MSRPASLRFRTPALILCLASIACMTCQVSAEPVAKASIAALCGLDAVDIAQKKPVDSATGFPLNVEQHELLPRHLRLPGDRQVDVLMVSKLSPVVSYKVVVLDASAPSNVVNVFGLHQGSGVMATTADRKFTDFSSQDDSRDKTLLSFRMSALSGSWLDRANWYRPVDLYVLGCNSTTPYELKEFGHMRSTVTNPGLSRAAAVLLLILVYTGAALSVSSMRNAKIGRQWSSTAVSIGFLKHLDPVMLSAGQDGKGSVAKLQMLFFAMIVLWLVFYIWLLTEHLSDLSDTVLLLMGISGIGATAAAGADLSKNRLALDNWSWLVNNKWLPQGGIAAVNEANWRDIFTTNGVFDVPRFQLVTFSVVVGIGLLSTGADLADLSTYSIPAQLLSILGLSQVVYVAGKLVTPPSVSDLDVQLVKVREAEAEVVKTEATLRLAKANAVANVTSQQKAFDDASATYMAVKNVARTAFVSIYQIQPNQYFP